MSERGERTVSQLHRPARSAERPPEAGAAVEAVFAALADPTRRAVLRDVAERGPATATEVASRLPVTRQAVAKHLAVLQGAGLVAPSRAGRENRFAASTAPLVAAERWLAEAGAAWDRRLDRLADLARDRSRPQGAADRR